MKTEKKIEEIIEKFNTDDRFYSLSGNNFFGQKVRDYFRQTLLDYRDQITEEVISYISQKEGWEESEDYYRKHFNLKVEK
jgi:hypothetical protein